MFNNYNSPFPKWARFGVYKDLQKVCVVKGFQPDIVPNNIVVQQQL